MADPRINVILGAKDDASKVVKGLRGQFETFKKDAMTGFGLGAGIGAFSLAQKGLSAVGDAIGDSIGAAIEFEEQLGTINTVAKLSERDLADLGDAIQDLSEESAKDTADLTSAMYDLVSAGVDAKDAMSVLEDATTLATGALSSTGEAVDLMTTTLNAWKLESDESTRVMDIWAQTVANGKVNAQELSASMAQIAPIASAAGVSVEEVAAGFATMTAQGTPAAQAATQMRAAITAMIKPNAQMVALQGKLNGETFESILRNEGLVAALEAANDAAGGNSATLTAALGSTEAYSAVLQTTGDSAASFAGNLEDMTTAAKEGGTAAGMAAERMDTLAFKQEQLAAKQKVLMQDIGAALLPFMDAVVELGIGVVETLRGMADGINAIIVEANKFFDPAGNVVTQIEALADALGGDAGRSFEQFVKDTQRAELAAQSFDRVLGGASLSTEDQAAAMSTLNNLSAVTGEELAALQDSLKNLIIQQQMDLGVTTDEVEQKRRLNAALLLLAESYGVASVGGEAAAKSTTEASKEASEYLMLWAQTGPEAAAAVREFVLSQAGLPTITAFWNGLNSVFDGTADAADDGAEKVDKLAEALKYLKGNIDEFSDVRPLRKVNDEIDKQKRLIDKAREAGNYAKWARHKAKLEELQDEREVSRTAKRAFEESQQQQKARRGDMRLLREQYGLTKGKAEDLRQKLINTFGKDWRVKVDRSQLQAAINKTNDLIAALKSIEDAVRISLGLSVETDTSSSSGGRKNQKPREHSGGVIAPGETAVIRQNEAVLTPASRTAIVPLDGPGAPRARGGGGNVYLDGYLVGKVMDEWMGRAYSSASRVTIPRRTS